MNPKRPIYIHVDEADTREVLAELTRIMTERKEYVSVQVYPYHGKQYPGENVMTIRVG